MSKHCNKPPGDTGKVTKQNKEEKMAAKVGNDGEGLRAAKSMGGTQALPGGPVGVQVRLADLAKDINVQHRERGQRERVARKHRTHAFAHAVRAGELLLEAKSLVHEGGDGGWVGWLRENFEGSQRTAYNYMDVAAHKDDPGLQPVANESGLKGALLYLSEKRNPRAAKGVSPADAPAGTPGFSPAKTGNLDSPEPREAEDEEERARERARREGMERAYTPHGPLTPDRGGQDDAGDGNDAGEDEAGDEAEAARELRREWARRWGPLPPRRGGVSAPVLRGPGSKDRVGRWIIAMLPKEHRLYCEPYLGTGAVLLNKPAPEEGEEVVNDKNKEISNFFEVLREQPEELARAVELSPFSEADLMRAYAERGKPGLEPVERARRWVLCAHQGFLRQTGKPSFTLSSAETSRDSVGLWNELPEHIQEAGLRMKEVKVSCRDATELIWDRLFRRPDAALYVDPPYLPSTRAPGQYLHEMPEPEHVGMLDALLYHPGAVFLSGYDAPLYHDALSGWESFDIPGHSSTGFRKEVLWMNEAAYAGALAAEAKRDEEAGKTAPAAPAAAMGMVYRPPVLKPHEPEPPAYAAVLGALLEGWRWEGERDGGEE